MKRMISIITALLCTATLCMMSGCSDFGFNPIGEWTLTKDVLYVGDQAVNSVSTEENALMKDISFVFHKSGTGVFKTSKEDKYDRQFTYEYDDRTVTVTYEPSGQEKDLAPITLTRSEDGSSLLLIKHSSVQDEDGHAVDMREEFVYQKK